MTELERQLVALSETIPVPPAEPFRDQVLARVATSRRRPRRKLFVFAITALVTASLGAIPGTRAAFARWFGFDSVRIVPGPFPTAPPRVIASSTPSPPDPFDLGPAVSIDEAEQALDLPVRLPTALGDPSSVHVVDRGGIPQVVAVYPAISGVAEGGALVSLFAAQLDSRYFVKFAGPGTTVETLTVDGDPAIWLEGDPHQIAVTVDGEVVVETLRLATNTLLRQHGEIVLRIEADVSRTEAVRLARTWEPGPG